MKTQRKRHPRAGNVLVITVVMMIGLIGLLALAVDIGYLHVVRTELQRSADAAAIAATWELVDENAVSGYDCPWTLACHARELAADYATRNSVVGQGLGLAYQDVQVGYIDNPFDRSSPLQLNTAFRPNAVQVRVRKTSDQNGEAPLFFARALGFDTMALEADATAALITDFHGFQAPSDGSNIEWLPFALDLQTWTALIEYNSGTDDWKWNSELGCVETGSDGIREVNLFPQGTGSPGNRGTVDIGSANNSTCDIARQVLHGISPEDLEYHGGKLELNEDKKLYLNGDTGISAGVKDELEAIKGQPRIIPIFAQVTGPGNNAEYTIVDFAGVRIMEVKLTGRMTAKRVIIQPCNVKTKGGIPGHDGTSQFIYSPVWLVR